MDLQLWTTSKLSRIRPISLRREITFYAPLLESLDFLGIEPVIFTRASSSVAVRRDGLDHTIAANVPRFNYSGEVNLGLMLQAGESLQYSVANFLDNLNTIIWFEENAPKSTPTNMNPFGSDGSWGGNRNLHIKHICKFNRVLTNAEINLVQSTLAEVIQVIPPPPTPPVVSPGVFINEVPAGSGTVYTLSNNPNLNSLIIDAHGATLKRVASAPGNMEYTASGTGNRTITLGMAPSGTAPFQSWYVIA